MNYITFDPTFYQAVKTGWKTTTIRLQKKSVGMYDFRFPGYKVEKIVKLADKCPMEQNPLPGFVESVESKKICELTHLDAQRDFFPGVHELIEALKKYYPGQIQEDTVVYIHQIRV